MTPEPLDRLRVAIAQLDEHVAVECYARMVASREYVPVDVLGAGIWHDVSDLFDDDDDALRHIGQVFRGRLGLADG